MSLSFFTQRRTVLLMSDEALYVYKAARRGRELVEAVPWDADNFEAHVVRLLENECGKKPVLILNDMIEQHYRKERLAQKGVGMLDKTSVVRRKLNMAFPNYPIKAFLAVKGDSAQKSASGTYIFAAVSTSDQLSKTLSAVRQSVVSVVGFFLLPVESADMLKKLTEKTVVKGKKRSPWTVLISHHKSGGLRQIVVKNGELALTRMSMLSSDQSTPEQWVAESYQEFEATMSYLSRFGYHKDDGLNIIVIGDPVAGDMLQDKVSEEYNYASLTVGQAAALLGMPIGRRVGGDDLFADILHVDWAASKSSFAMPMQSAQIDQISKPRKIVSALSVLLVCTALFLLYEAVSSQWAIANINKSLSEANQQYGQLDMQYQKEVVRIQDLGYDIELMQAALSIYTELEQKRIDILPLFRSIGLALGRDLHFDEIIVRKAPRSQVAGFIDSMSDPSLQSPEAATESLFEATLVMKYPGTTDIDVGNQEVRDLQARMQMLLPRYEVEVSKLLKDYEYVDEIVVETGNLSDKELNQDFVAELRIRSKPEND